MKKTYTGFTTTGQTGLPKWLLFVACVILMCSLGIFVWRDTDRQSEQLEDSMLARGSVLIWAIEGGARSVAGHMVAQAKLSPFSLLEEMAKQPDVVYIALVDGDGTVLAHSDPEEVGAHFNKTPQAGLPENGEPTGQLTEENGKKIYEVSKAFTPAKPRMRRMMHEGGMMHGSMSKEKDDSCEPTNDKANPLLWHRYGNEPAKPLYIYVGIDAQAGFDKLETYADDTRRLSFLLLLAGWASLFLVFYAQNYSRSKRQLKDVLALARQVATNLPIGFLSISLKGEILLCNKLMLNFLGQEGNAPSVVFDLPYLDWGGIIREVSSGSQIIEREIDILPQPGKVTTISLSASQTLDSDGQPVGYLFLARDLGEIKLLQKQLRLNERLSAIGNMAAGVAHEIRNPLSTVKGYATILGNKLKSDSAGQETSELMIEEINRLDRVVSDLLTVARPARLELASVRADDIVQKAIRLAEPEAATKGVRLVTAAGRGGSLMAETGERGEQLTLCVDPDKLLQALLNITLNAVQATAGGGEISLSVAAAGQGEAFEGMVAITVTDTGCGMSQSVLDNIFTPYFTTKDYGTGLGLAITHQIIEQHGGEIRVASTPGKGSTFTLFVPQFSPTPAKE